MLILFIISMATSTRMHEFVTTFRPLSSGLLQVKPQLNTDHSRAIMHKRNHTVPITRDVFHTSLHRESHAGDSG